MKQNKVLLICKTSLVLLFHISSAQIGQGGIPRSIIDSTCSSQIQQIFLPPVNNDSLLILDSISKLNDTSSCYSYNFGITLPANYNIYSSGTWEILSDSSKLWRLQLTSDGAYSNYLIFDTFYIPNGAELFAYNEDKTQILGAFTYKSNKPYKRFSLGPVLGESVILEYHEQKVVDSAAEIHIAAFIHSFKAIYLNHIINPNPPYPPTFNTSATCNINVMCPEGNGWCNQSRSVALIARLDVVPGHFAAHCSGALVTNERRDGRPYYLTANHCIENFIVSDFIFIFNYQCQDCTTPANAPSTAYSISGATIRANNNNSDFALLELSSSPPGNYNTYYSGWNNENDRPESGVGIHHPKGDIKKISTYSEKPSRVAVGGIQLWELNFDKGIVEGGSSGSPLFNEDKLIVGQLLGTYSSSPLSCINPDGFALYGRFDLSWDDISGSSNQLKPWLNPNGNSNGWLVAMSGNEHCKESYYFENANDLHTSINVSAMPPLSDPLPGSRSYNGFYIASGTIETGQNVTIQSGTSVEFYGQTIILGTGFSAISGSVFIASPQPCISGCSTALLKMASNEEGFMLWNTDSKPESFDEKEKPKVGILSDNIQIYPNPSAGIFEVEFLGDNSISARITIYNALGKLVYEQNNIIQGKITIDLSHYQKGIYTIQIMQNENSYTRKIILQ